MTSLEDREKQNAEQEPVILEVDVIHNQEPWMQEERRGYETLGVRVWHPTNKPDEGTSVKDVFGNEIHFTSVILPPGLVLSV
jgi:hypothetical protein